ncbi:cytochrome c family protein [Psychrobacter sp. GP33]|uniref:c-type cytochrome n=1 Tax=Psychrobacter sp. GP33 TaxID=2758709 RepID=UPI002174FD69|nr:c-type cytochrome [Psychrobacter sp. GP33]
MFIFRQMSYRSEVIAISIVVSVLTLSGCKRTPPDFRETVSAPLYTGGDADNGALIYEEACEQCHRLNPGSNKKGPQLMNIYASRAADLADYNYSDELVASGWIWDAKTLDPYIADAEKAMPGSKMLADPMPDARERADVIAYLSTLRAPIPPLDDKGFPLKDVSGDTNSDNTQKIKGQPTQMSNEPVEISSDPAQKPAADFR